MTIYDQLGVRRVLNAAGALTAVGGGLLPDEVIDAMRDAGRSYVDMHEFHAAVGKHLAELTHNEAAFVTSGCAAAVALGTLAAITEGDPRLIVKMPEGEGLRTEVVIHHAHRTPYDAAVRMAGGRLVQIGNSYQTFEWELEAAITPRTALVLWLDGTDMGHGGLDLATTVRIAHARGVPVLVDAAAQLPPHTNLWRYTRDTGADAAVFSGGKHLRGPQSSGLMVGTEAFIAAARANASPYQRLARALKPGKENIAGLVRAVELFLARDHGAVEQRWEAEVSEWAEGLTAVPGVVARRSWPNEAGQAIPRLRVSVRDAGRRDAVVAALWERTPRVHVLRGSDPFDFYLTPETLAEGEHGVVLEAVVSELVAHA
jgi:uncharacterized pyridoxal phosphate-dependent enzyme